MSKALFLTILITFIPFANAQNSPGSKVDYPAANSLRNDVLSGKRQIQSLTPVERRELSILAPVKTRTCRSNSHKCHAVCEAANAFQSAIDDLGLCVERRDYSDDCGTQFRDVSDAHDTYEDAVSDAEDDCE